MGGMKKEDIDKGKKVVELIGDYWDFKKANVDDVSILVNALNSKEELIRSGAALALGNIFGGEVRGPCFVIKKELEKNGFGESFESMKNEVVKTLCKTAENDSSENVRADASESLEKIYRNTPQNREKKRFIVKKTRRTAKKNKGKNAAVIPLKRSSS